MINIKLHNSKWIKLSFQVAKKAFLPFKYLIICQKLVNMTQIKIKMATSIYEKNKFNNLSLLL
jgi:hypothetical protein